MSLIDAREPSFVTSVVESSFSVFPESVSVLFERSKFSIRPVSSSLLVALDEAIAPLVSLLEVLEPAAPLVLPGEVLEPEEPTAPLVLLPVVPVLVEPELPAEEPVLLPDVPIEPVLLPDVPIEPWLESLVFPLLLGLVELELVELVP
jgi:hypothetical protein